VWVISGEADDGRAAHRMMAQQTGARAAVAPQLMALAAYLVRRLNGLRVRREQRLHHLHR